MINFTGTITTEDGITTYSNAQINLFIESRNKFTKTVVVAQIGKTVGDETKQFQSIAAAGIFEYENSECASFEAIQSLTIDSLKELYPDVEFAAV